MTTAPNSTVSFPSTETANRSMNTNLAVHCITMMAMEQALICIIISNDTPKASQIINRSMKGRRGGGRNEDLGITISRL